MSHFVNAVKALFVEEDGPTAVEYAVMLALIIVVCIAAVQAIGTGANNNFTTTASALGTAPA